MSEVVSDDYKIIEKIGEGSFGVVYLTKDKDGNDYAAKVEKKQESRLLEEHKIYCILYNRGMHIGIPKIYSLIQTPSFNILVMELLGPSLDSLFIDHNKKFDLGTVIYLGYNIVTLLENLHKVGFIHRDIKPNNFLIGTNKNRGTIYLTDFGLSRNYIKHGKHIQHKSNRNLIGTLRYASINMHLGIEPSRRDDLESVGYMLIYFLKGSLPWQGIKKKSKQEHVTEIGNRKLITNLDKLCSNLPKQFKEYLKICRELNFDEEPNYNKLKNLFIEAAQENNIKMRYQWIQNDDIKDMNTAKNILSN